MIQLIEPSHSRSPPHRARPPLAHSLSHSLSLSNTRTPRLPHTPQGRFRGAGDDLLHRAVWRAGQPVVDAADPPRPRRPAVLGRRAGCRQAAAGLSLSLSLTHTHTNSLTHSPARSLSHAHLILSPPCKHWDASPQHWGAGAGRQQAAWQVGLIAQRHACSAQSSATAVRALDLCGVQGRGVCGARRGTAVLGRSARSGPVWGGPGLRRRVHQARGVARHTRCACDGAARHVARRPNEARLG